MAFSVFGNPITDETLKAMTKYIGKKITRCDRAHEALNMIYAESKNVNALHFVEILKEQYGNGVSTLCVVYNATGDPITFISTHDWHGHLWEAPIPQYLANGQWGAFLHVHPTLGITGSSAAVVYRGKNDAGEDQDFMLSWMNPYWPGYCKAYTMVREAGYFTKNRWGQLQDKTNDAELQWSDECNGCKSSVSIGNNTTAVYEAKLTLTCAEGTK
ncbi:23 kDa jasmonate-induced protein-like [Asparagus officinalis]|uniref:23 kDa jasmonate-induced protein-like n=1 Tax=Asparagus officinalis TaxID=4686 RepID=UPI00098DEADE|nr:23 kDa jasmonate-induced protein-like [Asparagus officinalis]